MASTTASMVVPSSSMIPDGNSGRPQVKASPQCVGLPSLTPTPAASQNRPPIREGRKSMASYKRVAQNVMAMAAGGATAGVATTDVSDITRVIQEAWDKIEDKYAVSSLAVAGFVAVWGASGVISAMDRLPVVPGVLELVGIGYTGWFAYKNLIYKPDREALLQKIKATYSEIIGSS